MSKKLEKRREYFFKKRHINIALQFISKKLQFVIYIQEMLQK